MKTITKVFAAVIAAIGLLGPTLSPYLQGLIASHPVISSAIAAVTAILALFHTPSAS